MKTSIHFELTDSEAKEVLDCLVVESEDPDSAFASPDCRVLAKFRDAVKSRRKTVDLTESEAENVFSYLVVELENCEIESRRGDYQPGERDSDCGVSYRKAVRLLKSSIWKLSAAMR